MNVFTAGGSNWQILPMASAGMSPWKSSGACSPAGSSEAAGTERSLPRVHGDALTPREQTLISGSSVFVQLTSLMFWFIFNMKVIDNDVVSVLYHLRRPVFWRNPKNTWCGCSTMESKPDLLRIFLLALCWSLAHCSFSQRVCHTCTFPQYLTEAELVHVYMLCKLSVFMPGWITYCITATICINCTAETVKQLSETVISCWLH